MAWLPIASAAVSIFSTLSKSGAQQQAAQGNDAAAAGILDQGVQEQAAYDAQAQQFVTNAGQARAASQRVAMDDKTKANLLASHFVAAAGAGGGTGPQVTRLLADINAKGSYNASMDIYNGEEQARQLTDKASNAKYQGYLQRVGAQNKAVALGYASAAQRAAAFGDLASGAVQGATLLQKYGPQPFDAAANAKGVGTDYTALLETA